MKKQKVIVVMPAYNAAKTIEKTLRAIPKGSYDEVIVVDDCSKDNTVAVAKKLGLFVVRHEKNKGYGGNQKTCYDLAMKHGADIVVMLHPDFQYDPSILPTIIFPIQQGRADAVLASRFIKDPHKGGPLQGGMPIYKYFGNILLTGIENFFLGTHFSEFHTGYRAFSRKAIKSIDYHANSDDFVFDNEMILQLLAKKIRFKEVPVDTKYFDEASSIDFFRSVKYALGIFRRIAKYWMHTHGIKKFRQFE